MTLDQQASNLVDTTVNAFNGNATSISPLDGISLIDGLRYRYRHVGRTVALLTAADRERIAGERFYRLTARLCMPPIRFGY